MDVDHCFLYLHDQDSGRLEHLEARRLDQIAGGYFGMASETEGQMRAFLWLFMPDPRQPSIYGVFSV